MAVPSGSMTPSQTLAVGGIVAAIGSATAFGFLLISDPVRRWIFDPRLKIFYDSSPMCSVDLDSERIIRLRVVNGRRKTAKGCRAYIVEARTIGRDAAISEPVAAEGLQINWAFKADKPLDVEHEISHYLNLAHHKLAGGFSISAVTTEALRRAINENDLLDLKVKVVSEEGATAVCQLRLFKGSNPREMKIVSFSTHNRSHGLWHKIKLPLRILRLHS